MNSDWPYTLLPADAYDDGVLVRLEDAYHEADRTSGEAQRVYRRILVYLACASTAIALAFLLYDEAEAHWMLILLGVVLITAQAIQRYARRLDCHKRFIEQRELAEVLRVQIFLRYAGSPLHAADLLTWTQLEETGWVRDRVEELMAHAGTAPVHDIRDVWVEDQRSYHERAAARSTRDQAASKRVVKLAFWLSIALYVAAFIFELACGDLTSAPLFPIDPIEPVRAGLKIALGSVSAATLFIGSYYDKSSFSRVHEDHVKMERFFAWAGAQLDACGQREELLERIAREELIENGNWYSYQLEGAPDLVL